MKTTTRNLILFFKSCSPDKSQPAERLHISRQIRYSVHRHMFGEWFFDRTGAELVEWLESNQWNHPLEYPATVHCLPSFASR